MRKNKMLRLASGMMVATLLSTSVISGTFAKYVTTAKADDTAVVAKWGVTVSASGSLFGTQYSSANSTPVTAVDDEDSISVAASEESNNLVAPGTKSENGLSFGISGQPEVSSTVSVAITAQDIYLAGGTYGVMVEATVNEVNFEDMCDNGLYTESDGTYSKFDGDYSSEETYYTLAYTAKVEEDGYYPVKYALDGGVSAEDSTVADIAEAIAKAIDGDAGDTNEDSDAIAVYSISESYAPNDENFDFDLDSEKLTWEWTIGESDYSDKTLGEDEIEIDSVDAEDTILGDLMAGATVVISDGNDGYTILSVGDDEIVTIGEAGNEVGSLKTEFNIAILVEQVD
jgi:hypothetical protein